MYIGDFLNKIKWDKNLKAEEFTIVYLDRVLNKKIEIPFCSIERDGNFMIVNGANIPLHRIKEVKSNGKIVWSRK